MTSENSVANTYYKNLSLTERMKVKKSQPPCLLLDTSGSMATEIEFGLSRIDALRDIVKGLQGSFRTFHFGSNTEEITQDKIPDPSGGTNLAGALAFIKHKGFTRALLITDGRPNSAAAALEEAKGMSLSIMYVGPHPKPQFLDDLAAACSGTCTVEDLTKTKEITEKVQLLLNTGEKINQGGPIIL